jgi:RNA polymerase sigma factor (sigma-70 family)
VSAKAAPEGREKLFASTSWTLIAEAGASKSSDESRDALAQLCAIYWRPVYLFLRRQGQSPHDAQDLTQGFFADLVETRFYRNADRDLGRFRSFLLGALKHFLANRKDYEQAQKRGRNVDFVPLTEAAEQQLNSQLARSYRSNADDAFEREWGITLLRRVLALLEAESRVAGKPELFEALKCYLGAEGTIPPPYEEIAKRLSRSVVSVRKEVSRFRQRYRAILREAVRQTVETEDEVDGELRHLRAVMAS